MFDSLEETMKHDDDAVTTRGGRIAKNMVILLLAILLFGGLAFAVHMMT